MKLYYTVISKPEDPQTRPDLSLGGFKSSTIVPNNKLSNLFGDISSYSVRENQYEYIALALVNDSAIDITDITVYFEYPTDRQKDLEMAFVNFNASEEMEFIPNPYSQPYVAAFNAADGVVNAINIGGLLAGAKIGIWFKRIINTANVSDAYSNASLEANGNPVEANEEITLVMDWTE